MIAAALISLVSLDRLAAWVAMVIIAREFAVSGLRIAAGQQGVVIPASRLGKVEDDRAGGGGARADRRQRPGRRLGAGARLRDRGHDGRLGRRLLPQLPPHGSRRPSRNDASSAARPASREALDQLVAARAAHVERAVEELPVDLEHREQQVRGADVLALAPVANSAARSVTSSSTSGPSGGVPWPSGWSCSLPVMSGASPTPRACKVEPTWPCRRTRAKPALRLVLSRMGEGDRRTHECDHKGCVL